MTERANGTGTCEVEREGRIVRIILTCADDYAAMLAYDAATAQLRRGGLSLSMLVSAVGEKVRDDGY